MLQSKKRQFPSSGVSNITMCSRDALFPKIVKCSRISADITGLSKCCRFDEAHKSDSIDVSFKSTALKDFNVSQNINVDR